MLEGARVLIEITGHTMIMIMIMITFGAKFPGNPFWHRNIEFHT